MGQLLCIFVVSVFLQVVHQAGQLAECIFYILLFAVFSLFFRGPLKFGCSFHMKLLEVSYINSCLG